MGLLQLLTWFGGMLFAAAIISRLASDRQVPGTIDNLVSGVANIFHGVFSG